MLDYTLLCTFRVRPIHQHVINVLSILGSIKMDKRVVLPVVLNGCKTWSLTMRGKSRLRMLENRVMRNTFGPNRYEVTGEWRKPHTENLNDLYFSPNIFRVITSRRMRMAWACSTFSGEDWCTQGFGGETCRKETNLKTQT